jgi:hypothetical protein
VVGEDFDPIDGLVKEILGTARFLEGFLNTADIIFGVMGTVVKVVLLIGIALFLK